MAGRGFIQQRPRLTKQELEQRLDEILLEFVPGNSRTGPDQTMLRKADLASRRILALIEEYTGG